MLKGLMNMDDNISNLTFASGELSASSSTRNELSATTNNNIINLYPSHSSAASTTIQSAPPPPLAAAQPPPSKKRRSLPGNPDPDADVIALSPKTLMATNRFICEICNKGFQRDQNLQLHRRGHNLPWKLKQRSSKEVVRKKVYVCPEPSCVHHEAARALGDLTGIKKHFFRKHGEKKWKCEKCSKRYAVQSDWKAHSKICGTREYRCDCGTLFSRRDSFITHRAFCDALSQETSTSNITARALNSAFMNRNNSPLLFSSSSSLSSSSQMMLQSQLDTTQLYGLNSLVKREQQDPQVNAVPPWLVSPSAVNLASPPPLFSNNNNGSVTTFDHSFGQTMSQKPNPSSTIASIVTNSPLLQQQQPSAFASATALLQKAAQMGATMSNNNGRNNHSSSTPFLGSTSSIGMSMMPNATVSGGQMLNMVDQYNDMINSTTPFMQPFGETVGVDIFPTASNSGGTAGNDEAMTRDFLGLRTFPRRELFEMVGLSHHQHVNSTAFDGHHHQKHHHDDQGHTPWQG